MPVLRPARTPCRVGVADAIFNFLHGFLGVFGVIRLRRGLPVQRVAGPNGKHRLHVQVFAPGEEFEQAHAVGRAITPSAWVARAVLERPDRFLPVIAGLEAPAFDIVAAGKPQKCGLHVGQELHDVRPHAVGTVLISRREQRNQVEPERAGRSRGDDEPGVGRRLDVRGGGQRERVLLPLRPDAVNRAGSIHGIAVGWTRWPR